VEHLHHVAQVFEILLTHQLFLRRDKCQFGKIEVCHLRHITSPQRVEMDPGKIDSIMGWPKLKRMPLDGQPTQRNPLMS
jgi:hypothetical protein